MADSCVERVESVLASRRSARRPDGESPDVVVNRLVGLAQECEATLVRTTEEILSAGENVEEGSLGVLLETLTRTQNPSATECLVRAIESPGTRLKEDYVSMLDDFDAQEVGQGALVRVLREGLLTRRDDIGVTIRALHAVRDSSAIRAVAPYVADADRGVRGLAVAFLYDLDEDGTIGAPAMLAQLGRESDPEILEQVVGSLDIWGWAPAVAHLRRLADDDSLPQSLREEAAQVAIRVSPPEAEEPGSDDLGVRPK